MSSVVRCFVMMPFGDPRADAAFHKDQTGLYTLVKQAVESATPPAGTDVRVVCSRGDTDARPGEIISHLAEHVAESEIAIADLSGRNPNVFYELGVRHAVNGNTILIAGHQDDIPFDLRTQRTIIYSRDMAGMAELSRDLRRTVEEILRSPKAIDNPVRQYLYNREKEKLTAAGSPPGYDVVKSLMEEVGQLRAEMRDHWDRLSQFVRDVTSGRREQYVQAAHDLEHFVGVWKSVGGSVSCARIVDGRLAIPYRLGNEERLTAHYFGTIVIGNTLFARFRWFVPPYSRGHTYLRVVEPGLLRGGWWYDDDLPAEVRRNRTLMHDQLPNMVQRELHRLPDAETPAWAEQYFKDLQVKKYDLVEG